jgi:hypothetical protein
VHLVGFSIEIDFVHLDIVEMLRLLAIEYIRKCYVLNASKEHHIGLS